MALKSTPEPGRGEVKRPRLGPGDFLDVTLLVAGLSLLLWVTSACMASRPETWDAATPLCINGILAEVGFAIALRGKYPVLMTCFYFDFLFLAVAPIQQIGVKFDPIFSYDVPFYTTIAACLMFTLLGLIAVYMCGRPLPRHIGHRGILARSVYGNSYYPLVLWISVMVITAVVLAVLGPYLFVSRNELFASLADSVDKSSSLVITTFLAPFVLIGSTIGLKGAMSKRDRGWIVAFLAAMLLASLISINPFVLPRFRVSALTLFVLLAFAGWRNARAIAWFLVSGVTISPLLNAFREGSSFASEQRPFDAFFAHLDFDCFALTAHVIHYVGYNGYSYGSNILAGLLFFIPRAVWPEKSQHVGYYIWPQFRYYRNVWTDNLSSPPIAEGYFAYGTIGAIVFCSCVWAAFVLLERTARSAEPDSPLWFMACLTPIYAIMLLRGPFLVGYSELWGNYAALFAAVILLSFKVRLGPVSGSVDSFGKACG